MKSLVEKINESLINEARVKPIKTTVGKYVAWYFGCDSIDEVDPVDDFQSTDFDPESLEKHFKNSYTAQYEFLYDHRDEKITIKQEETEWDVVATFKVGKFEFNCAQSDFCTL